MNHISPQERKAKFEALLARLQTKKKESIEQTKQELQTLTNQSIEPDKEGVFHVTLNNETSAEQQENRYGTDRFGNVIEYNDKQRKFIDLVPSGVDCVLLGAAGTGKTTVTKAAIQALITSSKAGLLDSDGHKYLHSGTPGIVCVSYTRRAVLNLKKNMSEDMKGNCITIHKLLEYKPEYYTIVDPETGKEKTARKFVPSRTSFRPLPKSIKTIIIDESSMVGTDLFALILDALKHKVQFIFIGDIQQLPPIFSSAILGYKILELENSTVELTQVYRQALESPIIRLAHRILSGVPIKTAEFSEWKIPNKLTLHPWKKRISEDSANLTFAAFIRNAIDTNNFDIENDIILIPFNKAFGTDEINKVIATHLAKKENKVVYEIIAGFNRRYFAVGDRVLYDKEDAIIKHIRYNSAYSGALPQKESPMMDYWGRINIPADETHHLAAGETNEDIDFMLQQVSAANKDEDRVHASSHVITLEMLDTGDEEVLDTASDINSLMHGYALTIHKAQGSEWRKVLLVLHNSHATMIQRELLYTGVTRAKEELYVICEPETFVKGITNQRIQGNTLKEKAEYFKGKIANGTGNNK